MDVDIDEHSEDDEDDSGVDQKQERLWGKSSANERNPFSGAKSQVSR